ncbi:MAG TPA: DUF5658 family protein [Woeseiaceae bacterium]|nr:DUF5658 family protein [Woeseiaceae bacterium]
MELSQALPKNRIEKDRREFSWRTVLYAFARSRRQSHRRSVDDAVVFLDGGHPWLFFLATGTMLLSCADAFLTLKLMGLGMFEANPFMQAAMERSTVWFTGIKLAMTAFGILVLVFLAKARFLNRVRTGLMLTGLFTMYACLVCYELVNLFNRL